MRQLPAFSRFPAALLLASLVACGPRQSAVQSPRVTLFVENRGFFDVTVYALRSPGTTGTRIANVSGSSTATLRIPAAELQGGNRLVVRLRAVGTRYTWISPGVQISSGTIARLTVTTTASGDMSGSSLYSELSGN